MKEAENYTDEDEKEAFDRLGIKQKRALIAYHKYHKNMEAVMRDFLGGKINNEQNAFLLLDSFFYEVLQKTVHTPGATDGLAIDYECICGLLNYYKTEIKNAAERNTQTPAIPSPDTQTPEQKAAGDLPPVIQAVLSEGLLEDTPVNGKYSKKGDKKDTDIVEWIFDYSGYGDSLTTELYMQYIQTHCKPTTIQDYITRNRPTD
jgi:hypothetical protein